MTDQRRDDETTVSQRRELIMSITKAMPKSLSAEQINQLEDFVPAYFKSLSRAELADSSHEDLAGMALSHWQLAKTHAGEVPLTRVFNPSFDVQGWHSLHTVVQIVTTDQPWLVSSLQATLSREGHVVHRLVHPVLNVQRDDKGQWQTLSDKGQKESLIHIEVDAMAEQEHAKLIDCITRMFCTLKLVLQEASTFSARLGDMAASMENSELSDFVNWLDNEQFACLGAANLHVADGFTKLHKTAGILATSPENQPWGVSCLLPEGLDVTQMDKRLTLEPLMVCKAAKASPIIRDEAADLIMHAVRDPEGNLIQLNCMLGIFVAGLQNEAVNNIPWMRERLDRTILASGTPSGFTRWQSHLSHIARPASRYAHANKQSRSAINGYRHCRITRARASTPVQLQRCTWTLQQLPCLYST